MATPLREATLNASDEPNGVARRVQKAFAESGCPVLIKTGARKGQKCGATMGYNVVGGWCHCTKVRSHGGEAYTEPFGEFIWSVINSIPEEEMKAMQDAEDEHDAERNSVEAEKERVASAVQAEKRSKSSAAVEAAILGLEVGDHYVRPEGPAPDGLTWSYRLGEWVEPERLKKTCS
jgi:hypothetical protein